MLRRTERRGECWLRKYYKYLEKKEITLVLCYFSISVVKLIQHLHAVIFVPSTFFVSSLISFISPSPFSFPLSISLSLLPPVRRLPAAVHACSLSPFQPSVYIPPLAPARV